MTINSCKNAPVIARPLVQMCDGYVGNEGVGVGANAGTKSARFMNEALMLMRGGAGEQSGRRRRAILASTAPNGSNWGMTMIEMAQFSQTSVNQIFEIGERR